jgi:hypothetical protein
VRHWYHSTARLFSSSAKVKNPEKVSQFRPISLCNILVYKVISKCFAMRFKGLLPEAIITTQSTFVPRRDNILVAFESFHIIKKTSQGQNGLCAVKLDMHKTICIRHTTVCNMY